jgi:hypothetical protein
MANVFVYHASDREGRMLAALVRLCDAEGRFQFLPIDSPTSMARMHRFVERHGLPQGSVELPFVVLMDGERRALLHGPAFADWCAGLVRTMRETACVSPARLLEAVVTPHLAAHTVDLLRYALGEAAPPATSTAGISDAAATAGDERMPAVEEYDEEEAAGEGPDMVTVAVTPAKSGDRPERKVSVTEVMQQSIRRDARNQNTSPR